MFCYQVEITSPLKICEIVVLLFFLSLSLFFFFLTWHHPKSTLRTKWLSLPGQTEGQRIPHRKTQCTVNCKFKSPTFSFLWEPPGWEECAVSSPRQGMCSPTDASALWKGNHLAKMSLHLLCSRLPFDQILWTLFTPTGTKTGDRPLLSVNWWDIRPGLSPGVLAELWLEFPEFEVVGLIVLARVLLEICVLGAACLHQTKPGALGIAEWTQHRSDTPSALPWLPRPDQHGRV